MPFSNINLSFLMLSLYSNFIIRKKIENISAIYIKLCYNVWELICMAKKEIEVVLKTPDDLIKINTLAIITKDVIKYRDNDMLVVIKQKNGKVLLTRENNEYQLKLEFEKNKKTLGNYLLKDNNMLLELEILTKTLEIDTKTIYIIYELYDEIREYKVSVKE